jgi:DNA-binding LacI/PurR family transcriptional regulator
MPCDDGWPDDVAVIGFDDFPPAQSTEPPRIAIRQPLIRLLLEEIKEPCVACRHVILRTQLVVRESA